MRKFIVAVSALLLVLPDVAMAQPGPGNGPQQGRPGHQRPPQGPSTKPAPGVKPPAHTRPTPSPGQRPPPGNRPNPPNTKPAPPPNVRPPSVRPPNVRPPADRPPPNARPPGHRPPNARPPSHRPPPNYRPPPHRPGAGRPPHFRPIHGPAYHYPYGYHYRRWTVGFRLPGIFLSSVYYFDNYYALGVGAPPPGYRWVRYGPDLLLVQLGTGRIADVIYGAFY